MNREKAFIVRLNGNREETETLFSNIEFFSLKSGSASRVKTGANQQIIHESRYLEREKHQLRTYFKELALKIRDANEVVILGPGNTNEKFRNLLLKKNKLIAAKIKTVAKTDNMTKNQIVAAIRDYYKKQL